MSPAKKKALIRRDHPDLSINQQCRLVRLSRSAFYYAPVGIDAATLAPMKAIDQVFTRYVRVSPLPDAETVLRLIGDWIEDYNDIHPYSGLKWRSPREFIRAKT